MGTPAENRGHPDTNREIQKGFSSDEACESAHKLEYFNKSLGPYLGNCCLSSRAYGCKNHPIWKSKGD